MPPSDAPDGWNQWLADFRERFIAAKGWSEREAELRIRDAWAVVRDGQLHALTGDSQFPADAVPVFEVRTFGGWKTPIQIVERLTGLVTKAMTSQRAPRDILRGVLSQIDHSEGPDESNEVLMQRHTTALWAERLLTLCEHEAFSEVAGTDLFWNVVICALQTGRRLAFLEICRDPQVFSDLLKAQAFQSGRAPDELSRHLEASYLKLRAERGRDPKPREVAEAAGGVWSEIDDCWQFDDMDGLPSVPSGALYDRLDRIRQKHS